MPYPVSQRFLDMLVSGDQHRISVAQIWNKNNILAELGTVTDGSVSVDVTQPVRRTCTCTVQSQGLAYDDLIPTNKNSLLNPASGNELRLFRGFQYPDGTQELCPLGVFRMTKPVVADTGDAITISISGNDRSALMTRRTWTDVYPINSGTDLRTAVHNLVNNRLGDLDLTFKLANTYGITVPATTFGASLANSNDPWADVISLAIAGPFEIFFDETGAVVMQAIPNAVLSASAFPLAYVEGENCTFTQIQRSLDETQTYNGAIVQGVGSGGPPVSAEVWDTDPLSPLFAGTGVGNGRNAWESGSSWGRQPYIYQTTLVPSAGQNAASAQAQVLKMAQAIYRQVHTVLDIPSFSAVPNPALLESDVLDIQRERIDLSGPYVCGQMTMPLDTSSLMTVTTRSPTVVLPTQ